MTVRVYRSSDASAPSLTGAVGSLTALLDAILVNGYGSQSAAGWSIAYTTTNKRAYLQNTTGSNNPSGMYLYVDDTGPGAGGAREARACGFETMSAITPTGTGQFPTSAQSTVGSGQLVIRKSATADTTVRNWTCVANGQTMYLFIESGDSSSPLATTTFAFGDFKSYKSSDQYAVCIIGRTTENTGSAICDPMAATTWPNNGTTIATMNSTLMGHFVARSWTGAGGSVRVGKPAACSLAFGNATSGSGLGYYTSETNTQAGSGISVAMGRFNFSQLWPAPNGPDGAIALAPVYLAHNSALRGYLPGLWQPLHDRCLGHNDTFTVTGGNLNGKSMLAQNIQAYINSSANGDYGQAVVETSNTWS